MSLVECVSSNPNRYDEWELDVSISIAMATFNGADHLQAQLESLARQIVPPLELVVCDDCSTDETIRIVNDFSAEAPFPVRIFRNESTLGFADNFLRAASLCKGDWIAFCDQDDVWLPEKLASVSRRICEYHAENLMLVAHSAYVANEDLQLTGRKLPNFRKSHIVKRSQNHGFFGIEGFALVFKAALVRCFDFSTRPRNNFLPVCHYQSHDRWICMLANSLGNIYFEVAPLAYYRRHKKSVTSRSRRLGIVLGVNKWQPLNPQQKHFDKSIADESALILCHLASTIESADWRKSLYNAAEKYRVLGSICEARANIYEEAGIRNRSRYLLKIARQGGYFGDRFYAFGLSAFLKDLFYCFARPSPVSEISS
jgi:glycosyltransferase involved in cell wall biosynthesis